MPLSRKRHDPYGRPLPTLVAVEQRSLRVTQANEQQQRLIERLLQVEYDALLVHGMYAEVSLTFIVKDGSIAQDVCVTRRQQHRLLEEERLGS